MIAIILSIGAINAFIPLIIILILIVAAAGLMRGYNIFALFGISALLGGAGKATLARKNVATQTEGVRRGLTTRKKVQALGAYAQKRAISKGKAFAKYYKQEYNAARAKGNSRVEAAKIASANARIRMAKDNIKQSQESGLDKIDSKTNKKVADVIIDSLNTLQNSSALKNDPNAQNLINLLKSERIKLDSLAAQANQIQLNRTSAAAAKANLNKMRQIEKDYRETEDKFVKHLYKLERRFLVKGTMEVVPYYTSKAVNLVIPNLLHPNSPSFLKNTNEQLAHVNLDRVTPVIEKSFKKAFKP